MSSAAPSQQPSASFCAMGVATVSLHPQTCEAAICQRNNIYISSTKKLTDRGLCHFCTVLPGRVDQRRVRRLLIAVSRGGGTAGKALSQQRQGDAGAPGGLE